MTEKWGEEMYADVNFGKFIVELKYDLHSKIVNEWMNYLAETRTEVIPPHNVFV